MMCVQLSGEGSLQAYLIHSADADQAGGSVADLLKEPGAKAGPGGQSHGGEQQCAQDHLQRAHTKGVLCQSLHTSAGSSSSSSSSSSS